MGNTGKRVNAVGNSLEILHLIKSEEGARLSDIATQLELSKSTVHSHLNTLQSYGYITKKGEIYRLGLKFFHVGQHTRNRNDRYQLAKEKTSELAESLNHAVDFDVETNGKIMVLFHEANESTEVGLKEGDYLHLHTSSTGKAILAELPEKRVTELLDRERMPKETEYTITEPDNLREELRETSERGYAIVDQEWLEGLRAVGVAVTLPDGSPFGALSAGGPTYRLTTETIETDVAPKLMETAKELEDEISRVVE
ncbi:IclR family transcriptional regulator [Halostella sp. JP-L12]|uniref:IclR family transcriptional regulator n=1 Tax=Halostella TaxID=1843185 RepID=UPI000EF81980|nr:MULTISPECIES: IclR family transcriptional regulator [Halostella]NHN48048.1 IclR family transcriptional regulator [Halostella sp. JP-L12]